MVSQAIATSTACPRTVLGMKATVLARFISGLVVKNSAMRLAL